MITDTNQRWRDKRGTYRPAGEVIDTSRYEVAAIPDDTTAKRFVLGHHYSGTYPAARFRFGLYRVGSPVDDNICCTRRAGTGPHQLPQTGYEKRRSDANTEELVGVAVFGVPPHPRVITNCLPGEAIESVELSRFVLLDEVPGNGETWFLGRCFEQLRGKGLLGVVSFSDPHPRTQLDGSRVFGGHIGTIYQAHNAAYIGRGRNRTLKLLPDGSVLSDRALSKLRSGDRGWRYTAALLERHGAEHLADVADCRSWAATWVPRVTRKERHPGNHKYVWALNRRVRRHLPDSLPYPKVVAA